MAKKLSMAAQWALDHPYDVPCPKDQNGAHEWRKARRLWVVGKRKTQTARNTRPRWPKPGRREALSFEKAELSFAPSRKAMTAATKEKHDEE